MQPERKVLVIKRDSVTLPRGEVVDRAFLIELRRHLLAQLAVIERKLEIQHRCPNCAYDLSR